MAAHTVSFLKCAMEIMYGEGTISWLGGLLFAQGISTASFEILFTNLAMKYYRQIEVIPVF